MVTPETAVVSYVMGDKSDLKPGTKISSVPERSRLTARCKLRASPTARMGDAAM